MAHSEEEKAAIAQRIVAARKLASYSSAEAVAKALTARGYPITKAAVGHWETGRNLPDALWLRRLAKLFGTSVDALVYSESLSPESMKIAAEYDHLTEAERGAWRLLWLGYVARASEAGDLLPPAPATHGLSIVADDPDPVEHPPEGITDGRKPATPFGRRKA